MELLSQIPLREEIIYSICKVSDSKNQFSKENCDFIGDEHVHLRPKREKCLLCIVVLTL